MSEDREDRLKKEKNDFRRQEQERIFKLEMERRTKELAIKQAAVHVPIQDKSIKKNEPPLSKPQVSNSSKSPNNKKYVFIMISVAVIAIVAWMLSGNILSPASETLVKTDSTSSVIETITDNSREIEGKVLDSKSTPTPLIGATILNIRNETSTTTDGNGNFKLSGAKDGDTLLTTFPNYSNTIHIISKDQKSSLIQLQEMPRIKENKTITGIIKDKHGNPISGSYVQFLRSNKFKNDFYPGNDGKFKFTKVNEGDILVIKTAFPTKKVTVTQQNEYEIIVN